LACRLGVNQLTLDDVALLAAVAREHHLRGAGEPKARPRPGLLRGLFFLCSHVHLHSFAVGLTYRTVETEFFQLIDNFFSSRHDHDN
jgi:hypothetical protein